MWSSSTLHWFWYLLDVEDSCTSPAPEHLCEVVNLATVHALLPIGQELSLWMVWTTLIAALLCGALAYVCVYLPLYLNPSFAIFISTNSFVSVRLYFNYRLCSLGFYSFCPTQYLLTCYICTFFTFGEFPSYFCEHVIVTEAMYELLL